MTLAAWRSTLQERLTETLLALCRIPSPTFHEREVATFIRTYLEARGLQVREDGAAKALGGNSGNLICEVPGALPGRIALVAHMDTVPLVPGAPVAPLVDGDRVHTGGKQILGADDKAGVSVALELVNGLCLIPPAERPTVLAVFTVAEEQGLLGARELDVTALAADYAYVLDGEVPVGEVIATAPYKEAITITVKGRRAHAALEPERGVHAMAAAARVIAAFPLGRLSATAVTNLGTIAGGVATNVIPDEVTIRGELRSFSDGELETLVERIARGHAAEAARSNVMIEMVRTRLYDGYDISLEAPSLVRLRQAAEGRSDLVFKKVASMGGSDTNILVGKGLEAVDVGLGMHEIHSQDEWILVSDLVRVTDWLLAAVLR